MAFDLDSQNGPATPANWDAGPQNGVAGATTADPSISELPRTADDYARLIGIRWNASVESILKTCVICANARHALGVSGLQLLIKKLAFSRGSFSKLATAGADPRMQRDDLRGHLPPKPFVLYAISRLTDAQLDAALKEGVIHNDMHRRDLEAWIRPYKPKRKYKKDPVEKDGLAQIAVVSAPANFPEERQHLLMRRLHEIADEFPEIEVHGANTVWTAVANPEARNVCVVKTIGTVEGVV